MVPKLSFTTHFVTVSIESKKSVHCQGNDGFHQHLEQKCSFELFTDEMRLNVLGIRLQMEQNVVVGVAHHVDINRVIVPGSVSGKAPN